MFDSNLDSLDFTGRLGAGEGSRSGGPLGVRQKALHPALQADGIHP